MYDPESFSFIEVKTGHTNKEGKVPWDNVSVHKHLQLDFYSLLIKLKHGKVNNLCRLVWLETEFKTKTKEFQGIHLEAQSRELELTGKISVFPRKIFEWERKNCRELIKDIARQISEDYTFWQHNYKS
jgi:hypothetical protein